ncbi:hypothetical protein VNI00_001287 [Paramarasmius palmivorus]|uniref:Asl1-like glycosyl hydrolase catalytic domain-containing protein n=1 Tax=Paramarasmius palmivorus TaxID=297713 RepID=A0AAW0E866_9AGAR
MFARFLQLFLAASLEIPLLASSTPIARADMNPKLGISYTKPTSLEAAGSPSSVASWYFNYLPEAIQDAPGSLEFVGMQSGRNGIQQLTDQVERSGLKTLLGFYQPEQKNNNYLDPRQATELWTQYMLPLRSQKGIRLGAPVNFNCDLKWLQEFNNMCRDCFDFVPVIWFGTEVSELVQCTRRAQSLFGHPVWVIEFASLSEDAIEVSSFMSGALKALDGLDYVERYAWFAYGTSENIGWDSGLINEDASLNSLGQQYINGGQ